MNSKFSDQEYLLGDQYRDASKLGARIRLHQKFSTNDYGWMKWVFDRIEHLPDGSQILELGCGPGDLWCENANRIPPAWQLILSDFSPGMLDQAKVNLRGLGRPFQYEVIDAQSIPFEDGRFDAVIANHMLFFVPDRPKALAEIHRVLKPGGWLFATTTGEDHLLELRRLMVRFDPDTNTVSAADHFGLENGPGQLRSLFTDVTSIVYPDALAITEVEPLVEAVLSFDSSPKVQADRDSFTKMVQEQIDRLGVIEVTKASGMLVARKE